MDMRILYFLSIILCAHRCIGGYPQHVHSYLFSQRTVDDNGRLAFTCDSKVYQDVANYRIHWKNVHNPLKNTQGRLNTALKNFGCRISKVPQKLECSQIEFKPNQLSCSNHWGCVSNGKECTDLPNFPNTEVTSTTRLVVSSNQITDMPGYYGIAVYNGNDCVNFDILSTEQWNIYNLMKNYRRVHSFKDIVSSGHDYVKTEKLRMYAHKMALKADEVDKEPEEISDSDVEQLDEANKKSNNVSDGNSSAGAFLDMENTSVIHGIRKRTKNNMRRIRKALQKSGYESSMIRFKNGDHTIIEFEHKLWLVEDGHATRLDKSLVSRLDHNRHLD